MEDLTPRTKCCIFNAKISASMTASGWRHRSTIKCPARYPSNSAMALKRSRKLVRFVALRAVTRPVSMKISCGR